MTKKIIFAIIATLLLIIGGIFFFWPTKIEANITDIFHEAKGNTGVVGNVFIPDMDPKDIDQYNGKKVKITGTTKIKKGTCPEENTGEIVQCYEDDRIEMVEVKSIEIINE